MKENEIRIWVVEKFGYGNSQVDQIDMLIPKGTDFKSLLEIMGINNINSAHWDTNAERWISGKYYNKESGEVPPISYYLSRGESHRINDRLWILAGRVTKYYNSL